MRRELLNREPCPKRDRGPPSRWRAETSRRSAHTSRKRRCHRSCRCRRDGCIFRQIKGLRVCQCFWHPVSAGISSQRTAKFGVFCPKVLGVQVGDEHQDTERRCRCEPPHYTVVDPGRAAERIMSLPLYGRAKFLREQLTKSEYQASTS